MTRVWQCSRSKFDFHLWCAARLNRLASLPTICLAAGAACMWMLPHEVLYLTHDLSSLSLFAFFSQSSAWQSCMSSTGTTLRPGTSHSSAPPHPTQLLTPLETCVQHSTTVSLGPPATHQRGYGEERGGWKAAGLDVWHLHLQANKTRVLLRSAAWVSTSASVLCVWIELLTRMAKY